MMLLCFFLTLTLPRPAQQKRGDIGVPRGTHLPLDADGPPACTMPVWHRNILTMFADMKLPTHLWMAELGRPDTVWVHSVRGNSMDVVNTGVGIAYRLELAAEGEGDRSV